ncbi:MAG: LacI family DNA-binding transcriptional regulator [Victivallales bacterium]|nr:LacI family DNA-binding transcriptional regulator [Victivallales bacterium]
MESALTKAIQARVDAIICLGVSEDMAKSIPERFLNTGIPITGLHSMNPPFPAIFDQQGSAAAMTEYLVQCGYRKIICYGGNYRQMPLREAGYREVMEKHRLAVLCLNHHAVSPDELIDQRPDAIFCGDDYLACRLLQAAYHRRIRVPDVFGVAGFGNTTAGQFSSPALTTVEEPYFESGVIAIQNVIASLENDDIPKPSPPIIGKLIVRESTKVLSHRINYQEKKIEK